MFKVIGNILKWIGQHFMGMLFLLIAVVVFMPSSTSSAGPENLQEIRLMGQIMGSDVLVKEIESARKDPNIKGVLFNVDSPGGSVPASIEIAYAIKELRKHKPVVAYASGMMTSGSYYGSIHANKIIANPGAIIGSIGVILQKINVEDLMNTVGVKTQIVKQGIFKEAGTPTRTWTEEERIELETLTKDAYALFVSDVAEARGLDANRSSTYADAHIFIASRAQSVGLIDMIGTKQQAKKEVAKLANVANPSWKEKSKLDTFLEQLDTTSISQIWGNSGGLKATF